MAKTRMGCFGVAAIILIIVGFLMAGALGIVGWFAYDAYSDPDAFLTNYPGLVKTTGNFVLSHFSASKPFEIPEVQFNETAYDSFAEKLPANVSVVGQPAKMDQPVKFNFTSEEILAFLYPELAKKEIRHYALSFFDGGMEVKASVHASLLRPFLPHDLNPVIFELFDGIQYLNIHFKSHVDWSDSQLKTVYIDNFELGRFQFPEFLLEELNKNLNVHQQKLEDGIKQVMRNAKFSFKQLEFKAGEVYFEGLYNPSNPQ
jgi:hypothetical protein